MKILAATNKWLRTLARLLPITLLGGILVLPTVRAEPLNFSPMPLEKPKTIARQWQPAIRYLGQALGTEIHIQHAGSNTEIVDQFRKGQLDLAYLGPLPYVELKRQFPDAVPVVHVIEANGQAKYTCAIVALEESKLTSKALRGKSIALTQPLSTCGYLATDGMMHRSGGGLEHNRYRYLVTHEKVALAVARGEFDAGGLKTSIGRRYEHLGLRVIAESALFPSFALVANARRLSPQQIDRIRTALTSADEKTRAEWGGLMAHGVQAASDRDYDELRKLDQHEVIPEQGNF